MVTTTAIGAAASVMTDEEVVRRVRAGETALFEVIMRRYNQRLFRVTRAILGNDGEAEDVTQDAYVRSYLHLDQFEGRAQFSTWLTKIAVHEALARLRARRRLVDIDAPSGSVEDAMNLESNIYAQTGAATPAAFQFLGARCDRIVSTVMGRIHSLKGEAND